MTAETPLQSSCDLEHFKDFLVKAGGFSQALDGTSPQISKQNCASNLLWMFLACWEGKKGSE